MKRQKPFISVIVAVYNGAKFIRRCIDSITGQTYQHTELIIIDGGSTDGTVEILRKNDHKISYWESKPDKGIYHAWNKALKHAVGDWICFLGSDDFFWQKDVLEHLIPELTKSYPSCRVVYGHVCIVTANGTVLEKAGVPWNKAKKHFNQAMTIPHQAVLHHSSLFKIHGMFDESFRISGDYEFLLRELNENEAFFADNIIVAGMQHGGISNQSEQRLLFLNENIRARRKNNISTSGFVWFFCVFRSYLRVFTEKLFGKKFSYFVADFYRVCIGKPRIWTK